MLARAKWRLCGLLAVASLVTLAISAKGNPIEFRVHDLQTASGDPNREGEPVAAQAVFVIGAGTVIVELNNFTLSIRQNISGVLFELSDGEPTSAHIQFGFRGDCARKRYPHYWEQRFDRLGVG